jgi:hypothetical protein
MTVVIEPQGGLSKGGWRLRLGSKLLQGARAIVDEVRKHLCGFGEVAVMEDEFCVEITDPL